MSSGEDRRLEELLDAAGRAAQPTHPGWKQLSERLSSLPQLPATLPLWQRFGRIAAAAALVLIAVGLLLYSLIPRDPGPGAPGGPGVLLADDNAILVERLDMDITVLNAADAANDSLYMPLVQRLAPHLMDNQRLRSAAQTSPHPGPAEKEKRVAGLALVKDHRLILNLQEGENLVRFTDVAASMDPTSVRFVSNTDPRGTQVLEQSFEYDLATADTLLRRYLERPIVCVDRGSVDIPGILLSFDADNLVLTGPNGEPQTLLRSELQAIRLQELPEGLVTRPTLVWKLQARLAGKHDTTLSYLCGNIHWQADYVLQLLPGNRGQAELFDLKASVTIENQSGATFQRTGLKLLAGEVNRVPDPWSAKEPLPAKDDEGELKKGAQTQRTPMRHGKTFTQKPFFDYHLYTLNAGTTIKDRQIKQLHLLQAGGVQAERRYIFDPLVDARRVAVQLVAKNTEKNGLGQPLPRGRVTVMQNDGEGDPIFLGRDLVDHTAANEDWVVHVGNAVDIAVDRRQAAIKRMSATETEQTMEIRLRSQKSEAVTVRCVVRLGGVSTWQIKHSTDPWQKLDAQTIYFDVTVSPDRETVLQWTQYHAL